jgi:uncharacterized FAD-dependent dehydrogenase
LEDLRIWLKENKRIKGRRAKMKQYDVIIVGAGPAGIFSALELYKSNPNLNVLMLEKGNDIDKRTCPVAEYQQSCANCKSCSITSGFGGAGAFSDGKLTLTTEFGGRLGDYIGEEKLSELIDYIDKIYLEFGATDKVFGDNIDKEVELLKRQAAAAELMLIPARIRHLGTEQCYKILQRIRTWLDDKVDIKTNCPVEDILVENGEYKAVRTKDGTIYESKYIIVAPGRDGADWFSQQAIKLNIPNEVNPVDIGVRVEVPAEVMNHITDIVYESKFIFYSRQFDDRVRTFCMNPNGAVVVENSEGLMIVNGHSYQDIKTQNTNFALLVSKNFTEPFKEPLKYGKYIANLANMLGGGVIVQRLGDLQDGRRSTESRIERGLVKPTLADATPGDLSLVLPHRYLVSLLEMLEALDKVAPGVNSRHTLLYGVEVKFYSNRVQLDSQLRTNIDNMWAIGDGAGITRGLAQASVAGVVAARSVLKKEN